MSQSSRIRRSAVSLMFFKMTCQHLTFSLDIAQLAQQLNAVRFEASPEKRTKYVTAWISGVIRQIPLHSDLEKFLKAVADNFDMEKELLRIYVLQSTTSQWRERIRLTTENFDQYISGEGLFRKASKLYAMEGDTSPNSSPGVKTVDVGGGSQSSKSSNRNGQSEFSDALRLRDE